MPDKYRLLHQWLLQFNWKERYYLVDHALDGFKLGSPFREQLGDEIGIRVPANAFAAMDYHLDWIYAAITLSAEGIESDGHWETPANVATGKQLDTDLLVVFELDQITHIVMVEAKAKGAWDNKQMRTKVARLTEMFGENGNRWGGVTPHWVLMSPRPNRKYALDYWSKWMKKAENPDTPYWLGLRLPSQLSSLHQSDKNGKPTDGGDWFTVKTKPNS